jgi:RNA polymerase sigma-70 factor (ECF subfamily)
VTSQQRGGIPINDIVESPDPKDGPFEETNKNRLAELTNQAMMNLSADHREILHMAFYEGQSYPEISELLGIPVNTVKTRVYYAKQQLKKTLQHHGVKEEIL